jgi:GTP:adenosylcobinamide-phosphate guanylyltransferase
MITALVMAASRRGPADPVAQLQGLSHKCLVRVFDRPMIEHVLGALAACSRIGDIIVSVEDAALLKPLPLVQRLMNDGRLRFVKSGTTLADSVAAAVSQSNPSFPLLITTADNALHDTALIDGFCEALLEARADVVVGMTRADVVLAAYPEGQRAFHRFRDGGYSSCNLYALRTPEAVKAARAFATGGQFAKKPWRIAKAFGLVTLAFYKLRWLTLDQMMRQVSRALGVSMAIILVPRAEGPIDIDNPRDFALAEKILAARSASAGGSALNSPNG